MSLSLFFPLILAYMAKAGTGADTTEHYLQTRFDYVYTMMLGYGLVFLLPCLIGIIAAILFFILLLTICFSFIGCVIALAINIIAGFSGVHFGNLFNLFIRVIGANIGIYISVLPIILLFCCSANNFLGGVALAFLYGYFGSFVGKLLNYYPIKASMILVDSACDAKYGVIYQISPACITIVLTFLISMIILANKKKEPSTSMSAKKKKIVRKKGW